MAGERIRLEVTERTATGSRESRRLRRAGLVPGVLYGGSEEARAFAVAERELRRALGGGQGMNQILDVAVDGSKLHHAVLKEYQLDPLRSTLTHVDLQEVRLDRPIQTQVAVELLGTPEGVTVGGVLSQTLREVTVEALPMEIPDRLELDVAALAIGDSIKVAELAPPGGVAVLDDPETVVASVLAPRKVEEELEAEGEAAEGEAGEPGEAEAGEAEASE